jgi:hypothetical protein
MIIIIRLAAIVCPNEKKTSAIGLDTALRQAEPVQYYLFVNKKKNIIKKPNKTIYTQDNKEREQENSEYRSDTQKTMLL